MLGCPQTSGHAVYFQLKQLTHCPLFTSFFPFSSSGLLNLFAFLPTCLCSNFFSSSAALYLISLIHPPHPTSLHPSLIIIALLPRRSRGTITADHIAQQHGRPSQQAPSLHGCKRRSHKNRSEPSKCHESAVNSTVDILKASTYERVCLLCPTVCDGRFADCVPSAL